MGNKFTFSFQFNGALNLKCNLIQWEKPKIGIIKYTWYEGGGVDRKTNCDLFALISRHPLNYRYINCFICYLPLCIPAAIGTISSMYLGLCGFHRV
ncbi:hypothetical protein GDO86_012467 [Hymenochirus boettgeri]|uniref:Uncharacterized protein n=1 Tax=Hymenochirus boettgeri TaxID=247094 RepID=A0A8T2IQR7_9PIPI|nr:hypothetical protein GDO86_012467 [Hymenochirus boettgeri]